ncbi:MAG: glycosyltransferase [Bacteroidales bacterium]|nr:glycosyltransferase [Bacteroidales bacterium]
MEPLVSVIVPVYNIGNYLPRCLDCIEMQTYKNLEIILVDDGSSDGSGQLCDEFAAKDPRARVIHHPENRGLWAARNTGQDVAHGEYLWFPDGDDYFHKDIIKIMYEAINRTNASGDKYDVAFVGYEHTSHFDKDTSSEIKPDFVEETLEDVLEVFVRPTEHFTGRNIWNKLYRRELINDIRTGNYRYAQDCDFSLKVYQKAPRIIYVDEALYFWVYRQSSAISSANYNINSKLCVIRILYDNFRTMNIKPACCRRYTLEFLYIYMATLLDLVQGTNVLQNVRCECKKIVRHTSIAYLNCKTIQSFKKRLSRVLKIRFDRIFRALI